MTWSAGRAGRLAVALLLAALALLPVATWIPGGDRSDVLSGAGPGWLSGSALVLLAALLLALVSRRVPALWHEGAGTRLAEHLDLLRTERALVVAAVAVVCYAFVARWVFSAAPLNIDQIDQIWQGRVYASGHLTAPDRGHPELFGVLFLDVRNGMVFSQFPAGGPAMLALGTPFRAEWLVGPLFGGLAVWWWARALKAIEEPTGSATVALLLLAFSPFVLLMSGSYMNHTTTQAWLLGGIAGMAILTTTARPGVWIAVGTGLAFGLAGAIRPAEGFAFGAPAGAWLLWRAWQDRSRVRELLLVGAGMAIPLGALLWVNAQTTGNALLFAYTHLWGPGHGIGFHDAPWGERHTPVRGLEYLNIYLLHFQVRFLEAPVPALLPALGVLGGGPRFKPFERYLLVSGALILLLYWAYWFKGLFLGPRFLYPLVPVVALFTARAGGTIAAWVGKGSLADRAWSYGAIAATLTAIAVGIPARLDRYRRASPDRRWSLETVARAAGATDALVLVRESWGEQVRHRMVARGVPPLQVEYVYWHSDICRVEQTLERLERAELRDSAAIAALLPLAEDSLRVVAGVISPDLTERAVPGEISFPGCTRRLLDDRAGFTLYSPTILEQGTGNVYVQDQYARDSVALMLFPDRPVFLLAPEGNEPGAALRFRPLRRDSLLASWRGLAAEAP